MINEEKGHGTCENDLQVQASYWIGNTSRDQYSGVFEGLAVAYDVVDDPEVNSGVQEVITLLLEFLLQNH